MDNTLNLKLIEFEKALTSLRTALKAEKTDLTRDSVIKRFEYTFELLWKSVKIFLSVKFGKDVFSPKECFRELKRNQLISDEETEMLLKMTDDRNEIVHNYNEDFSEKIYDKIKDNYYGLIEQVLKVLNL